MENSDLINKFLSGRDPMEHIISIECGYDDEKVSVIYRNADGQKRIRLEDFKPFVWAKRSACIKMFDGNRKILSKKLHDFGIRVKELKTSNNNSIIDERLEEGYKYMFYSTRRMSFQQFLMFFQIAKTPIYPRKKKNEEISSREKGFLAVSPIEQYMMYTGKRLFKGYDGYDELKRMLFDLETQGLNPNVHAIDQIGIRTNQGYEKVISIVGEGEEKRKNEIKGIEELIQIIAEEQPDVICGHNSEKFDWNFIIVRCEILGTSLEELSLKYFKHPIFKKTKQAVLKLGGEVEYYYPTVFWGFNILDSLHAVRRAQAIDSSMKSANLKYVTKYLELNKENRVYVPGNHIGEIWMDLDYNYAFNNTNGDWYNIQNKEIKDGYQLQTGRYIVERYLLDDIWETDKVELALNEANFLVCKMLPTTFSRACTMGTAGIWKLIMLAWCYENNLGIPSLGKSQRFTGGLSRLLKTGYVDRVVKLDYNSLYPSIMLTWNVQNPLDISNAMLSMLNYVLTNREYYKGLKAEFGAKAKAIKKELKDFQGTEEEKHQRIALMQEYNGEKNKNDKKQLPLKILGNSVFGAFGGPAVFPFGFIQSAEKVTCIGRQCLRLMISHFTKLGYTPIVGDSFTGDTPLFIRYKDSGKISIKPISEIIDETQVKVDGIGREYDYSTKPYQVLCRSGWSDINYIYRHKTTKPIYEVSEGDMRIEVTEDHSLFDSNKKKIKPSEITDKTHLEYYTSPIEGKGDKLPTNVIKMAATSLKRGIIDRIPIDILNSTKEDKEMFLKLIKDIDYTKLTKTCMAGILFLKRR